MEQRGRPRDLYDIVNLFRRRDLRHHPELIREVLLEKCRVKEVSFPTFESLRASPHRVELESEWANMLAHQLPALPPFDQFWDELPSLFAWLELRVKPEPDLAPLSRDPEEEPGWTPPATAWTWGTGVPLEVIRFAGANWLCIELGYRGGVRLIEPYSLRRTRSGQLVLHALRVDTRAHRSYRVDRIESVTVTTIPFRPVYAVEFSPSGPLHTPPVRAGLRSGSERRLSRPRSPGTLYVIQCVACGKRFTRRTRDTAIREHKSPGGWPCSSRKGYMAGMRYR
jgi:hypothetical protein